MTNDQNRTPELYGGTITLLIVATIAVALRLVARRISVAKYWWDDFTLVVALIFDYALTVSYWIQAIKGGLGHHTEAYGGPVSEQEVVIYFKAFLSVQICYFASAVSIKTSLILLYYRIFGVHHWFRLELVLAEVVVLLYFIVDLLVAVFECKPVAFFWDKSILGGKCIDQNSFFRWNGVANLLIDFAILTLTLPLIWQLNLKFKQKVSLSAVFLLGTFACVASIVRVITFNQVNINDITYTIVSASIWSTIEQSVGIICACLITYQPLFSRVLTTVKSIKESSNVSGHNIHSLNHHHHHQAGRPLQLSDLGSESRDGAGFSRLDDGVCAGEFESSVTTSVTSAPRTHHFMSEVPPQGGIVKNQSIEQHHDRVS